MGYDPDTQGSCGVRRLVRGNEVPRLLVALDGEMSRQQLADALGMTHREHFRRAYLKPALDAGLVEMTLVAHANL